jgi:uncharacterized protein (DUF1015 family)
LSDLIAPPYDVLSRVEREAFAARSPHNIVHLTLPEGRPTPYAAAAKVLARWRSEGALVREAAPTVYVVQQEFFTPDGLRHVRTGVMGGLRALCLGNGHPVCAGAHLRAEPRRTWSPPPASGGGD